MNLLDFAKQVIAIPTVSGTQGTTEIVRFLEPLLTHAGCRVQTQEVTVAGKPNLNLLASMGPESGGSPLLINTHLDTVPAGDFALWNMCAGNPYQATIQEDYLYGLGVADTKLAFVCALCALIELRRDYPGGNPKFNNTLHLMTTAGEELGLLGALHAMKTNFVRARYALDSEPSDLGLVWAHKGLCAVKIFFRDLMPVHETIGAWALHPFLGESAHSSTPAFGNNAIDLVFTFLEKHSQPQAFFLEAGHAPNAVPASARLFLPAQEHETPVGAPPNQYFSARLAATTTAFSARLRALAIELSERRQPDFDPPYSTTTTTLAGVTDAGQFYLFQDCRFIRQEDADFFLRRMTEIAALTSSEHPGVEIQLETEKLNGSLFGNKHSAFVEDLQKCAKGIGLAGTLATKSGCTEASVFASQQIETIVFGPGVALNNIHKPNERVRTADLHRAKDFYKEVIRRFCLA